MTVLILGAVFLAALLNSLTPGPSIFLVVARTSAAGLTAGIVVTAGVVSAQMIYLAVAGLVIAFTIPVSDQLLSGVRLGGAALLVHMAWRLLAATPDTAEVPKVAQGDYFHGVLVGFANPFNLVFMFGVLPQVVPAHGLSLVDGAWIASTVLVASAVPKIAMVAVTCCIGRTAVMTPWVTRGAAVAFLAYAAMAVVNSVGA